ncbi:MAG TPA: metallophosphoesterase [Kofleriaceae bacterium]|nr:metallophosphoesterase [Kofleriaceae bacterium]
MDRPGARTDAGLRGHRATTRWLEVRHARAIVNEEVANPRRSCTLSRILTIQHIADTPLAEVRYLNAARRGGTEVARLPIVEAFVDTLPDELDAIVVTSDLQGIAPGAQLLGICVAEVLEELAFDGALPRAQRTGVILAGDLYSVPEANKRGGYGEVAEVWRAFAERFAWVTGVAGNHDDTRGVDAIEGAHLLDGDVVELDGLRIAGVGGIIGAKQKRGRRAEDAQLALVTRVLDAGADILVLHEGPCGGEGQPGNDLIRSTIDAAGLAFAICGHDHWRAPLAKTEHGQILNVDTRVVVLRRGTP